MRAFLQSVNCVRLGRCLGERTLYLALCVLLLSGSVVLAEDRNGRSISLARTRNSEDPHLLKLIQGIEDVQQLPVQLSRVIAASAKRSLLCQFNACLSSPEIQKILRYADQSYSRHDMDSQKPKSDDLETVIENWEICLKTLDEETECCSFLGSEWVSTATQHVSSRDILSAAKMEYLRAKSCSSEKDFTAARQAAGNILQLASSLNCNWSVMSCLLQAKLVRIVEDVVRDLQNASTLSEEELTTLQRNLSCSVESIRDHAVRPWIGMRAEGLLLYEIIREGRTDPIFPYGDEEVQFLRSQIDSGAYNIDTDEIFFLEKMQMIIDIADDQYESHIEFWDRLESELQEKSRLWNEASQRMDPRYAPLSTYLLQTAHVSFRKYQESIESLLRILDE